ncbi:MAG: glycosyltransferase family 4 protein [Trichodesmium sp.]
MDSFKTLFIVSQLPYPPMAGAPLRDWQNINLMKKYGEVAIFSLSYTNPKDRTIPDISLWYHHNVNTRGSLVERIEKKLLRKFPWVYTIFDETYSRLAARKLDELLIKFQPQLVVISHLITCQYLPIVKCHKCQIIFDDHNVEADLFRQKSMLLTNGKQRLKTKFQLFNIQSKEGNLVHKADQVWACSEQDVKLLQNIYGNKIHPYVIPNGINVNSYENVKNGNCSPPTEVKFNEQTLIFIGSFDYQPNLNAANFLIDKIYPRLRDIYPECQLLLVGKNPPQEFVLATQKYPNIICTGTVPDVKPYLAVSSVVVTPLFEGSGTRLKILEAFAAGRPVVTTTKGVEGINAKNGEHLLIRDDVEGIIDGISLLWSDLSLGKKLVNAAYELVQAEYSWEAVAKKIEPAVKNLFE